MIVNLSPSVQLWCCGDNGAQPRKKNNDVGDFFRRKVFYIKVPPNYVEVTVKSDACHGKQRRDSKYQLCQSHKLAKSVTEYPASIAETDNPKGHVQGCHEDVGKSQVFDQYIGNCVEPLIIVDGNHHQNVSCKSH